MLNSSRNLRISAADRSRNALPLVAVAYFSAHLTNQSALLTGTPDAIAACRYESQNPLTLLDIFTIMAVQKMICYRNFV
jgi:hypothetical protein